MIATLSENETLAFLKLVKMLKSAATPTPVFMNWIADRLINHGDNAEVDFVQKLRHYSILIGEIQDLLDIRRQA